ncbi:MAG: glycosyltransferase family 2 protein [Muribaculaceae bacterium]|nr:glycosyltransferase family 2 protein [Muribaculaceae bacterium]
MISVIVPVYNVEDYLRPCLDSILNQIYSDFEVILVDDGSTDTSGIICDEYSHRDSRIYVIHQSNAGMSDARNEGIKVAKGDYITFVDADDLVHPAIFQVMYEALISSDEYDFSMVYGQPVSEGFAVDADEMTSFSNEPHLKIDRQYCFGHLFGDGETTTQFQVVWNKLYKKELIQGLAFRKIASEDTDFNNRVFLRANKAILVNASLYYWVQRHTSITHSQFSTRDIDCINTYKMCLDEIPKSDCVNRSLCLSALYKVILHTRYNSRNTVLCHETGEIAKKVYLQTWKEFIYSNLNWKRKFGLLFFYHCPWSYCIFRSLMAIRKR